MVSGTARRKITEICFGDWSIAQIAIASCRPVRAVPGGVHTPSRIFYDCSTYRYSGHIHCTSHYVRQEQIYAVVRNAIDQQVKVAVDIEQLVESIRNSPKAKRAFTEASETSESITAKRKGIENRIEGLLIALTERIIDRNEYEYMKAKYSQQLKTLLKAEEAAAARRNVVQEQLGCYTGMAACHKGISSSADANTGNSETAYKGSSGS